MLKEHRAFIKPSAVKFLGHPAKLFQVPLQIVESGNSPADYNLPEDAQLTIKYDDKLRGYQYTIPFEPYMDEETGKMVHPLPIVSDRDDRYIYRIAWQGVELVGDNLGKLRAMLEQGISGEFWNPVKYFHAETGKEYFKNVGSRL